MKGAETERVAASAGHESADTLRMLRAVRVGMAVGMKALTNETPGDVVLRGEALRPADPARAVSVGRTPVASTEVLNRNSAEPALSTGILRRLVASSTRTRSSPVALIAASGSCWV